MKASYESYDFDFDDDDDDDETPYIPPPQHWTYYLALFLIIIPIKAIIPLSWLITIIQVWRYSILSRQHQSSFLNSTIWEHILTFWVVMEASFFFFKRSIRTFILRIFKLSVSL